MRDTRDIYQHLASRLHLTMSIACGFLCVCDFSVTIDVPRWASDPSNTGTWALWNLWDHTLVKPLYMYIYIRFVTRVVLLMSMSQKFMDRNVLQGDKSLLPRVRAPHDTTCIRPCGTTSLLKHLHSGVVRGATSPRAVISSHSLDESARVYACLRQIRASGSKGDPH